MRIGGAFPFSITDQSLGGSQINLAPGQPFYPVSGNYNLTLGNTTIMQTWDPVAQAWQGFDQPNATNVLFDVDGVNWRLINLSGCIVGASITNVGSGGTNGIGAAATGVSLAFGAPASPGVTAAGYAIVGGSVQAPTIVTAGTGFLVPPLVVIDPPPLGGIQASAICTLTAVGGGIASITMVNVGAGYASAPNFYLIPQFGSYVGGPTASGAIAAGLAPAPGFVNPSNSPAGIVPVYFSPGTVNTAQLTPNILTGSGTLTGIVMTNYGSLYTGLTIPGITITGCGAAAATALGSFVMTGISSLVAGTGYSGTPPTFQTSLGLVAAANNNNQFSPRNASGVTTLTGGAVATVIIEDAGFGLQKVPIVSVINAGSIATAQSTFTVTIGGVNDTSYLQARVNS